MRDYALSLFLFFGLLSSLVMGLSSVGGLESWLALEANMLFFVGLLAISKHGGATPAVKYLVVQAVGSSMFLATIFLGSASKSSGGLSDWLAGTSLCLKLGVAPFHSWFVAIMTSLSWESLFLASTLQKILPLFILQSSHSSLVWLVVTSSLFAGVGGSYYQNNLKRLMAYSSIYASAWVLSASGEVSVWLCYLMSYAISLMMIASIASAVSSDLFSDVMLVVVKSSTMWLFLISFLSLAGTPPTLGFFMKLGILKMMVFSSSTSMATLMVLSSAGLLYVYMRLLMSVVGKTTSFSAVPTSSLKMNSGLLMLLSSSLLLGLVLCSGVSHSKIWAFRYQVKLEMHK